MRHHRPSRTLPWWLLCAGVGLFVLADLAASVLPTTLAGGDLGTVASFLGYIPVAGAAVALIRARLPGGDREGLIDAGIFATAAGLVVWELDVEVIRVEPLHAGLVLLLLVPVFALGVRLLFTGGKTPSEVLVAHRRRLLRPGGQRPDGHGRASGEPVVLHSRPDRLPLARRRRAAPVDASPCANRLQLGSNSWGRLMLLAAALLVGPTLALVRLTLGARELTAARPVATAVLGGLVLWRLGGVAAAQNAAARRSRVLAEASRTLSEVAPDYPPVLHVSAQLVSQLLDDPCAVWIIGSDGRFFEDRAVHHPDPEAAPVLAEIVASVRELPRV